MVNDAEVSLQHAPELYNPVEALLSSYQSELNGIKEILLGSSNIA